MTERRKELQTLSPAQREIMEIVWEHGEVSVSETRTLLAAHREVARNTVRTLMERMEEKGWLKHRVEGRTYIYSAAQPRKASIGRKVVEVLDQVCGGSPEALVNALIDYRGLSDAELKRIRGMLDAAKSEASGKKRKSR